MSTRDAARPGSLPKAVPAASESDPLWYKDAVIYQVHVRGFFDSNDDGIGDFPGLTQKLDYIKSLNVSCIWLQPFYPSPLRDDGYDIAHYEGVHPSYGTRRDFRQFLDAAHDRGIRVITELVINHTSDQHPWFQAARRARPGSSKRDFYVWNDNDQRYPGVRIIFTDTERSNWTWDPVAGAYYWHRFFHHQPDLNFDNPQVRKAVQKVMRFWLDQGVDGMRLDAVPYLIERDGTICENLPETHGVLKEIRRELDGRYPDRMLLAEANQWPSDVRAYFGDGDECHMAFHFPLMPRLFMALRQEDRHPVSEILSQTPDIPTTCQWAIFLRNHDELTLEMVTDEERDYMYQSYAADPQMRLNQGIRRRLAPLMENSRARIELLMGLLLSLPGTPILYYGDELAMGDNIYLGDRNGVRTPMQWTADRNAGFSRSEPARLYAPPIMDSVYGYQSVNVEAQERSQYSLLNWTRRLVALRQQHRTFGRGSMEVLQPENRRVLAYIRRYEENDPILVVANLAGTVQPVSLDLSKFAGMVPVEMTGGTDLPRITEAPYFLTLARYGFYWLILKPEPPTPITVRSLSPASAQLSDESPLLLGPDWSHVLSGSTRELLERRYLAPFIRRQRWFGHGGEPHTSVRILDWGMLGPSTEPILLTILATSTNDGEEARYFVPLAMATGSRAEDMLRTSPESVVVRVGGARKGVLHGQLDPDTALSFLSALSRNTALPLRGGRFVAWSGVGLADITAGLEPADLAPIPSTFEQSNSSIRFGQRLILKVIRRVREGVNPELDLGRFLTEKARFSRAPRLLGAIEYTTENGGSSTLAVMHEAVQHQSDAWQHALGVMARYLESALTWEGSGADLPPIANLWTVEIPERARETVGGYLETAAMLGRRTAELHLALSTPEAIAEFGDARLDAHVARRLQATTVSEAEQLTDILRHLPSDTPDEVRAVAVDARQRVDDLVSAIRRAANSLQPDLQLTRIHGDYHLGQVLLHEEDAYIVDFEGEPARPIEERRRLQSPMKDVAGMVRSFSYASGAGLSAALNLVGHDRERLAAWARWWHTWSAVSFLQAYRTTVGRAAFLPDHPDALNHMLRLFLFEKAVYETRYEAAHRPAWLAIPLADLLDLLASPSS